MRLTQWMLLAVVAGGVLMLAGCPSKAKQDTPKAALESMDKAAKDMDVDVLVALVPPDYQKAMKTMMTAAKKMKDKAEGVKKTVEGKLGKDVAESLFKDMDMSKGGPLSSIAKDGKIDWSKVTFKEEGDKATVVYDGKTQEDLVLKKIDGKWYMVPDEKPEALNKQAEQAEKMLDGMLKALDEFEKAVKDGKVTKENAKEEFGKAMMGAMMGAMGG